MSASRAPLSVGMSGLTSSSRERIDFWKASLNVRPMAMFSPTLFMWVVRRASANGNFSKAQRGVFTTT
ncbi:MAG: hypothetical protein BWY79_01016 [Actinobacteria bacterium ADurb.Bin444]|nr:MAG: hypothetical protein BWY79_01016 [Actinobacteria bacterium ADurb.Bin444]